MTKLAQLLAKAKTPGKRVESHYSNLLRIMTQAHFIESDVKITYGNLKEFIPFDFNRVLVTKARKLAKYAREQIPYKNRKDEVTTLTIDMVNAEDFNAGGTYANIAAFESAERKKIKRKQITLVRTFESERMDKIAAQEAAADVVERATTGKDVEARQQLKETTEATEILVGVTWMQVADAMSPQATVQTRP